MVTAAVLIILAVFAWPSGGGAWRDRSGLEPQRANGWRVRRAGARRDLEELARATELLAMALRAGTDPLRAVDVSRRHTHGKAADLLGEVQGALVDGDTAAAVWQRWSGHWPEAGFCAAAWSMNERLGVPLAPVMTTTATVLRERVAARRRLEAATAGARASMMVLTMLPLVGMLAGLAFGMPPWELYTASPVAAASLLVGLLLTGAGWLVGRAVLRRAHRPVTA